MNTIHCPAFVVLAVSLAISGFSQDTNTTKSEKKSKSDTAKEESRSAGLRKIAARPDRDWDFDIHIDQQALNANIDAAVENAMKSVDVALKNLDIHLDPIDINLGNLDIEPIEVHIPNLDFDLPPVDVDQHDLHIDMNIGRDNFHWNKDRDNDEDEKVIHKDESTSPANQDKNKEKDKAKDKSDKKDKTKGLKKLN
jgi:hypothetical protein